MSNQSIGKTTESAIKVLRVMAALQGHMLNGVSNSELAKKLDLPAPTITRCCHTLITEGYAQKLDNGRYCLGVKLVQIAQAHTNEFQRMQGRMDEINQRVLAGSS